MLYYLGRLDGQIKLNGFRVELEDVENNLVKLQTLPAPLFCLFCRTDA